MGDEAKQKLTREAVRNLAQEDGEAKAPRSSLNATARTIASQYARPTNSPVMISGIMRIIEFLIIATSGIAVFMIYVGLSPYSVFHYLLAIVLTALAAVFLLELADSYQLATMRDPFSKIGRLLLVYSGTFALMSLAAFFLKISEDYSRVWFGAWYASGLVLFLVFRIIMSRLIRRWARNGKMERRAVIVGGGKPAEDLVRSIEQQPYNDIRICGVFDDRDAKRSPPIVAGYPKLGNISELIEFARIAHIDMLIVCLPITAEERVLSLLKKLWVLPVDIRLSAHNNHLQFRPRAYSYIGSVAMIDLFDKPINDWDSVAKRAFDVFFSLIGITLFSPIMLATALAIKLESKGPVIFKQQRHGFNNEIIEVWKFRSMYSEMCDPTARNAVVKNDPRVTRVGRFIRKTSIDELPQFFNALMGTLSLVGPRPHAIAAHSHNLLYNDVVDGYFARHRVKPGVTGWAQINGWRGEIDSDEKIKMRTEFDLFYIENWSLWLDLKILVLTPVRLLNTENAY
ncbi:undecaprenyl-phosphate glucose phosphotransferase [Phyllobacterium sp. 21LDTY02-6]|uniref:undecaprenyl-phosphate glucose phosphotransferase n=1 Tax=unclassified Phyllobacterium TaxID=2638441 RepID=UPI002021B89D|nr:MULTISPECIES: undecaprenyl-phosphate glucose phosphotransferase [unclassified Phyllobacterium]MCO4319649.1 undecaprenyl-phosphate glucose phosphotransferase [Phyllobacterium sp. 21LDTY02-6]MCX8280393.1 undecaprenyl-phosphate glucose phosphotransferase [Phyllobacterium sp. 0TCS1.6C]MCX8295158.1 undecaprenyl-phosphate glucose phosphotransferase [Phyllobacterium sp. 0TCS1.6A]